MAKPLGTDTMAHIYDQIQSTFYYASVTNGRGQTGKPTQGCTKHFRFYFILLNHDCGTKTPVNQM